jgi:hypothetical protein
MRPGLGPPDRLVLGGERQLGRRQPAQDRAALGDGQVALG